MEKQKDQSKQVSSHTPDYSQPTFGKWRVSKDGCDIETDDDAALGICSMYATERSNANAELIASTPTLKAENEKLKEDKAVLLEALKNVMILLCQ